jgi:uncharacterized membrane protein YraQ (UPF0718 family)
MLLIITLVLAFLSVGSAAGLYFLLIYPVKAGKRVELTNVNTPFSLDPEYKDHLLKVPLNKQNNELVFVGKESTKRAVVSVITKVNNKRQYDVYSLDFSGMVITIPVDPAVEEYTVVLESVNGKKVNSQRQVKPKLLTYILYSILPSLLAVAAIIVYGVFCSTYLKDYFPSYVFYYFLAALGLLPIGIMVGSYFLLDFITFKGRN